MKRITLLLLLLVSAITYSQDVLMQDGVFNRCEPDMFYDSGGEFGSYSDNENFVVTICAATAGDFVRLNFTEFSTQLNNDILTIYDGDDISAPVIGAFSGVNNPGLVEASSASGCLTLEFVSNGTATTTGWIAEISCLTPCQSIVASIDSTVPAATGGVVEVDPGEIVQFSGSATFSNSGANALYTWDFGNGNSLTGENVSYPFPNPGTYTVTLIVSDDNPLGCSGSTSITVDVLDNDTCAGALPICSGISNVPSPVGIGNAEAGIDYGCLGSEPNPRWYFLQSGDTAGDLNFTLTQDTGQNGTGTGIDVDFIIWGPFSEPVCGSANLNSSTEVDCSYSAAAVENINIPNAPPNSVYMLLITNFNGGAGYINLELDPSSTSDTNCDIICQVDLGDDQELCSGGSYEIVPDFSGAFNVFEWQKDGVTIPGETGSSLTVTESGTYTLLADGFDAIFGDPCSTQDEVVITIEDAFSINDISIVECSAAASAQFDLENEVSNILTPLDPVDYTVTFYNTQTDAENGLNEINPANDYTGTNGEIIYVRVEAVGTDCYETSQIELIISGAPFINPVLDMVLCDDVSNDGVEAFDLDSQILTVLGTQDPALYEVTFHTSFSDADLGVDSLTSPYTNTVNQENIFVRVTTISNPVCYVASPASVFDLIVDVRAIANTVDDMVVCDDISADEIESFDLNSQITTILNGQTGVSLTFHPTQADADANTNALTSPYTNISNPQTIYVRVENDLNTLCFSTTTFDLIVNPKPTVVVPSPLQVCDDDTDGFAVFTLTDANTEVINGQANIVVSYYETLADANSSINEIFSPYTNIVANSQTVYVRLDDTSNGCYNTTTLDLEVIENPIANVVTAIEVCDDDNDGFTSFDLSLADAQAIGGQVGMVVTYHETQSDADNGVNDLLVPYDNIVPNVQTVYVRVESGSTGCYDTTDLTLIVNPLPDTVPVTAYELCDYDLPGDEVELFDLTTKDVEVANGQSVAVSYYESLADAQGLVNPLGSPYSNTSNPQTIYYASVNMATGCIATGSFDLVVNPLPALVVPSDLEVCDDGVPDGLTSIDLSIKNVEITGNNPNYTVSYYLTQSDADNAVNPLPIPYTNTINGQIIFVRVQDINTGCYATTTLTLVVEQAPVASTPTPMEYCDADSDGFGVFTLTDANTEITGGDPTLTVSYHETMADADNDVNALTSPYNNIVEDQQTIYARVESATIATDCATIVELILIVNPTPQIEDPTPLEECDDVLADGFAQFDLTSKDLEILDGLDPLQYIVTYYEVEANADLGVNSILNPTGYINTTAFMQTLSVRVEDTVNGCYKLTSLELIVNALPVLVQPQPLELCDDNNPGDEVEAFTLEDANAEMLNGQTGISFTYYETQLDADNGTNPIVSPYMNTSNAQTIFVRATDDVTGCSVSTTATILLRVNPIPSPAAPTDLEVCDLDNDGFEAFDLESKTVEIENGELDIEITYHETQSDADMDINALTSLYTNIVMDEQVIYIRAENINTGCYNTSQTLTIRVLPSPEVPTAIDDYVICDTNDDGFAQFDLSSKDSEILGTQVPSDFMLTYHVTEADADSGANPIANVTNYTNVTNPQTIYVRLVSNVNGCVTSTGFFDIRVELPPEAVQPTPLELCDDLIADEVTVFDLTVKDNEITGGEASWSVSYYETDADAQAEINAVDAENYTNTSVNGAPAANPQTLYVVVTDTDTGCVDYTTLTIRVLPNPTPSLDPEDLELCDDVNPSDMEEEFDLTLNEAYIINGESGVTATYHESEEDAELDQNAIADPTAYTNTSTPQTIYVRVENDITECYTIVTFDIIVNPLPDVVAVTDFILCELNTDGIDEFDLTSKDAEILNGQDPMLFTVTYHVSQTDADDLANPLVSPYMNVTNPQPIYVAITNNNTGCSISTPVFNIEVHEAAEATSPAPLEECDDEMDDDGDPSNNSTQFNLTDVESQVLNGQDPANYIVTYYETVADAELGVNPLPFLYENIVNPQVIYARVDNDTQEVALLNLDLSAVTMALDFDGDGNDDTIDVDNDGVFDLIDVNNDTLPDGFDVDGDGLIDYIDLDGDGLGDFVDIDNDGVIDNSIDSSICYAVAPVELIVHPRPVFDLEDSYILCVDTNGTEVLNVPVLDTGLSTPDYLFEWSLDNMVIPGATEGSYIPSVGGTYSVIVTDAVTGCSNFDNPVVTEVIESSPPTSILTDVTTDAFSELHIIEVTVTGLGVYEYRLDGGAWQESHIFVDVLAGDHVVEVRDTIGCGYAVDTVTVMDYPKYFTPNGDGFNDTWNIKGIADQPSAKIYIFDRYGKLMKQISPTGEGWNGTYNGSPMPSSDYWFVVEYIEPNTLQQKEFKAHFTLKR
ncbi:T9SS type B sorting domain-containing protein [Psychroserpens sp. S379A]|uniref:T9SS type B sorting domain-containing protein n=2 Tax=Psychroserpens sp. S379A TaxID=3415137 RepID=UPI003C7EB483